MKIIKATPLKFIAGLALLAGIATLVSGCVTTKTNFAPPSTKRSQMVNAEPNSTAPFVIPEKFVSKPLDIIEMDTPAVWYDADNKPWVIVTGKGSHQLAVFDGNNGELYNVIGEKGKELGQFKRPNAVVVFQNLALVTERDNKRIQVLRLPDFKPVMTFGEHQLQSPYGLWLNPVSPNEAVLYVTDSFMEGAKFDIFPDPKLLNQRVQVFRVKIENGHLAPEWIGNFGSTTPSHALHRVESLSGNPATKTLLIVDEEDKQGKSTIREYTQDGTPTGNYIENRWIQGQAEGISLLQCKDSDFWIVVDQLAPHTIFHVFGAKSLVYQGSFRGNQTSATDGIDLSQRASAKFPNGVLYAIDRDQSITAFDLTDIVNQLKLPATCLN